jgi:transposase, IS5 family
VDGKHLGFSDYELTTTAKSRPNGRFIAEMEVVMPSQALLDLIESGYPKTSKKGSKPPYPMTAMLLIHYETTIDA